MPHIGFRVSLSLRKEFVLAAQRAEGADMRTKERQEVEISKVRVAPLWALGATEWLMPPNVCPRGRERNLLAQSLCPGESVPSHS